MPAKLISLEDAAPRVRSGMRIGIGGGPLLAAPAALLRAAIRSGARDRNLIACSTGGWGLDLYCLPTRIVVFREEHSPRIFVERVDCVNAPGSTPPAVVRPGGPSKVVTPLCVFRFDPATKALGVESLHPGVTPDALQAKTGFLVDANASTPVTPEPTRQELEILRTRVRDEVARIYPDFARHAFLAA